MRALAAIFALAACNPGQVLGPRDTGLDGLTLTRLDPGLILPGTLLTATGRSFVDEGLGTTRLRLVGELGGRSIDAALPARYLESSRLQVLFTPDVAALLGGAPEGELRGTAAVEVDSTVDNGLHTSPPLDITLRFASTVTPTLAAVGDGLSFVNQPIEAQGDGFLLGADEGETRAVLEGCFTPDAQAQCGPAVTVEIAAAPAAPFERRRVIFPYATRVSGIGPGVFSGTLRLDNVHASGTVTRSAPRSVRFDIQPPAIFKASTTRASLGQYVVIDGGGFAGGVSGEATLLELRGMFTPTGGVARPIDLSLVPEFVAGPRVRYVLDEGDPLGMRIDLRKESGVILGTVKPIVVKDAVRIEGTAVPVGLEVLPVKQVVFVHFLPSYVSSLRKFGLRAADPLIRARVLAVARRDYAGINVDLREAPPEDFALFAEVDLSGPDPNGLGLLGYDNSPGKDVDNQRLYDRIGGVNATTQQDGYPGYGGVFTESFFSFSEHPNGVAMPTEQATPRFDAIFDPFRADRGGKELTASELAQLSPPTLGDGSGCPAERDDRAGQIACAVFVLGNLIGGTMSHEVGHSLGLANPYGEGFHNRGDEPNRLMDAGGDRPFDERAEIGGLGPAAFCTEEFDYLRLILPSPDITPNISRPPCN
jgi:hypothetical protein